MAMASGSIVEHLDGLEDVSLGEIGAEIGADDEPPERVRPVTRLLYKDRPGEQGDDRATALGNHRPAGISGIDPVEK
jgi:hypothetical protein